MDAQQELLLVGLVLDRIGVPPSDQLRDRLQFLQGAVLGFQLFGSRWESGTGRRRVPSWERSGEAAEAGLSVRGETTVEITDHGRLAAGDGTAWAWVRREGPGVPVEQEAEPAAQVAPGPDAVELERAQPAAADAEEEEAAREQQLADLRRDRDDAAVVQATPATLATPAAAPDPVASAIPSPPTPEPEPPLDWDLEDAANGPDAVRTSDPADTRWTAQDRKAFFASLTSSGITDDYEVVAAYCESKGAPRPSAMTEDARNGFLRSLTVEPTEAKPETPKSRLIEWAAVHGDGVMAEVKAAKAKAAAERKAARKAALAAGARQ